MSETSESYYLTIREVCEISGESKHTIYGRVRDGFLLAERFPLGILVPRPALDDYLQRRGPRHRRGRINPKTFPKANPIN